MSVLKSSLWACQVCCNPGATAAVVVFTTFHRGWGDAPEAPLLAKNGLLGRELFSSFLYSLISGHSLLNTPLPMSMQTILIKLSGSQRSQDVGKGLAGKNESQQEMGRIRQ